jgi:hypothetical protein
VVAHAPGHRNWGETIELVPLSLGFGPVEKLLTAHQLRAADDVHAKSYHASAGTRRAE